jgi:tripartite-type tricarboxylate transporter receptor subunit TctC
MQAGTAGLGLVGGLMLALVAGACAAADPKYPLRAIRYVTGGAAGGGADVLARGIGQKLGDALGQQVIVENRTGAGGIVATEIVARSAPDGHTLLMAFTSHVTNPTLYPKLSYDVLRDFAAVTMVATVPNILVVHPSVPARTARELVALARKHPGDLSFASTGAGASTHLAGILFTSMTGTRLLHVPYRGAGAAITAVVAGESAIMFGNMVSVLPQVKSGKLRGLAVTGQRRSTIAPELPTLDEAGIPGYEANAWFATFVPAGTPTPIVERLNREIVRALTAPDLRERLTAQGADPVSSTPDELERYTRSEITRWAKVIRESGARPD